MTDTDTIVTATVDIAEQIQFIANNAWLSNQLLIIIFGVIVGLIIIKVIYMITEYYTEGG